MACGLVVLALACGCGGNVVVSGGAGGDGGAGGNGGAGGSTGTKNACQKLADDLFQKYASCGINVSAGNTGSETCTPALAAQASCLDACIDKIDCACIKDSSMAGCDKKLKPYSDCATACLK
jgi:hypothetical protein